MKTIFSWLIDKWLAGFITASIFFTAKIFYDLPPGVRGNFFKFNWFNSIINYPIKFWIVAIIVLAFFLMYRLSRWNDKQKLTTPRPQKVFKPTIHPEIGAYTNDTFGPRKSRWTWGYKFDKNNNAWNIDKLVPICPTCGTKMELNVFMEHFDFATCTKCRLEGKFHQHELREDPYDISQEIIRRIAEKEKGIFNIYSIWWKLCRTNSSYPTGAGVSAVLPCLM